MGGPGFSSWDILNTLGVVAFTCGSDWLMEKLGQEDGDTESSSSMPISAFVLSLIKGRTALG